MRPQTFMYDGVPTAGRMKDFEESDKMKKKRNCWRNCRDKAFWIFLAVNLLGISITCFLESGLGCDPIALLSNGISKALSTSFGIASFLYNAATICLACLLARKFLGAGTIVYGLLSGFVIDLYGMVFQRLSVSSVGLISNILFFMVGEVLMSAAFAILMHLDLGMTALDALLTALSRRTKASYAVLKAVTDAVFVVTGIFLGGAFGAGTIVSVGVTGILVTKIGEMLKGCGLTGKGKEDTGEEKSL